MYSIGDIARLGGVSARMLRHYDEIGLFHPAAVDANGYRRYHPAQLARLHRIVALRDLGFGLDAIAELVGGDISPDQLWGMLRLRQAELEAERAVLEGRLQRLSRHLVRLDQTVQGGTPMAELAVTTKTLDGLHVAELSSISPTFDPSDIGPALSPLYPQLLERVAAAGVKLSGVPLAYYEDDPDGGGIIVHAAAPIPSDVTALDGVAVVDLEPVDQAVCCLHLGDMSSVDDTVTAMLEWIADHGLRTTGYTRESYLACPDDRAAWVTEMQLPVTKETSPPPSSDNQAANRGLEPRLPAGLSYLSDPTGSRWRAWTIPLSAVESRRAWAVSVRHENLSDEEQALQSDLASSWERAQATLADPTKRAYLEESIERVNASTSSTRLTKDEFLAQTELPSA